MKKKWIIISAVVVALAGGGYYGWSFLGEDVSADKMNMERPEFPTVAADVGEVKKTIFATGTVEAKEREEVKPEISGKVEQLLVKEGQHVNKGDVLFTIDSDDAALELQKLDLSIARIKKDLAELKTRKETIVADKAGRVKEVKIKEEDTVTEDTVIATMVNTDYLKITGRFTAYEAERFKIGQKVKVFLPGSLSYVDGVVSEIDLTGTKKEQEDGGKESEGLTKNTVIVTHAPHGVEVLVKKQGALYAGEEGLVQYTDPSGLLYSSAVPTKFELPDEIELRAGTSGKVQTVLFKENDNIAQNQLLVKMDTSNAELELREKELSLQEALLSQEQKRRDIAKRQVVAPVSGEVTKLEVEAGETIDSSKPAMVIMDTSSVFFRASVDELDIPAIEVGQTVDVYISAFGSEVFKGTVVEIPKEGKEEDKNVRFEVKVAIQNNGKMSHGMTGDCDINISQKENVTRLPIHAVEVMEEGKGTVMVKDPGSGEPMPKEVEIGIEGAEFVEIKSGIAPGEEVLMMNGEG